ncbi:MAG: replication initiation protein [Terrisporobacter othiniensis]|jgi:replication protein|nr:replication initiation protein [Terrisporobacter othiniensis]
MINKSSLIFYKGEMMIKYHNNLNKIALKGFNQRELGIFFAICSIMKEKGIQELEITFSELERIVGISFKDKSELVDYIRNMSRKLLDLKIESSENGVFINFVLFRTLITDTNTEKLTIRVNEDFSYILNDLTKHFTLFELKDFNQLNSIYAKHLYRLLKQFKYTGMFRIEISEFRRLFDIPMSYRMTDINRRVLTPAMKEVSQFFTSLTLIKEKEGKNIKYLKFTFDKEKRSIANEDSIIDISIDQSNLALIHQPKENIVCPKCGQLLSKCTAKNGDIFWGHKNYLTSDCKATYSSIEEIEAARVKEEAKIKAKEAEEKAIKEHWYYTIQDPKEREEFEKEVKQLLDNHSDVIIFKGFTEEHVIVQMKEKAFTFKDLSFRPNLSFPINRDTINELKKTINDSK